MHFLDLLQVHCLHREHIALDLILTADVTMPMYFLQLQALDTHCRAFRLLSFDLWVRLSSTPLSVEPTVFVATVFVCSLAAALVAVF